MADLDTLRPEVREAVHAIDHGNGVFVDSDDSIGAEKWRIVLAELLRLAARNAELEAKATRDHEWFNDLLTENKKAEAELAALKARILPGTAKVEIADTDGQDGNPYGWVGGTLLSHNLIGKRVRLVVED